MSEEADDSFPVRMMAVVDCLFRIRLERADTRLKAGDRFSTVLAYGNNKKVRSTPNLLFRRCRGKDHFCNVQ